MQRLKIPQPVDACVCALDSINYDKAAGRPEKAFRRVYESLRPGGLFVFDINTPYKLESLDGQVFLDETEDSYCVWRAVYDRRHSLCRYGMDLFQRLEDDTWERSFEEHVERAYTPEELSGWLTDAGFAQVGQFGNLRLEAPENGRNSYLLCVKERMNMQDLITRAMTKDGLVNAVAISSTGIVERARQMHKMLPTATAALGRLLSAASMMGNMQKTEDGSITLQIKGGGPLGTLLAVSDAEGNVRGYVDHPQISLLEKYRGKLDVGAAVGADGMLTVIRDLRMKEPYVGSVALVSGEIAEDITQYFVQSEQIPTACALGVLIDTDQSVRAAGGYLIQLMPGATDDMIDKIEAGIEKAGAASKLLDSGMDGKGLLETVLSRSSWRFSSKRRWSTVATAAASA